MNMRVVPKRITKGPNRRGVAANDAHVVEWPRDWLYPEVGPWVINDKLVVLCPRGVAPTSALATVTAMRRAAAEGRRVDLPYGWRWRGRPGALSALPKPDGAR